MPAPGHQRARRGLLVALALPASVLAACSGSSSPAPTRSAASPVIITVGSVSITDAQVTTRLQSVEVAVQQGGAPSASGGAMTLQLRARVVRSLVDDAVIAEEARFRGVAASDKDVQAELDQDIAAAGGSQDALVKELEPAGGSIDQVRDEIRSRINEQRVEDLFAAGRAAGVLDDARRGADLATLARQYSDDVKTRDAGGALGAVSLDLLRSDDAAFAAAASALPVGQLVTAPVRDAAGYEILRSDAATATTRTLHRILVAAPRPYTVKERPQWFTLAIADAVQQYCTNNKIRVLGTGVTSPCSPASPAAGTHGPTPAA